LNLVDCSHFFGKNLLWLPVVHYTLGYRIFLWGFLDIVATREFYEYVTDEDTLNKRLGHFLWISHLLVVVEWCIIIKFWDPAFNQPFPYEVVFCWSIAFVILSLIGVKLLINDIMEIIRNQRINGKVGIITNKKNSVNEIVIEEN